MPFTGFNELREQAAHGRETQEAIPGDSTGTKKAPGIQPTGTSRQKRASRAQSRQEVLQSEDPGLRGSCSAAQSSIFSVPCHACCLGLGSRGT